MADEENTCKACGRVLVQVGRGHRQRQYCDDRCRQEAFHRRRELAEREHHQAELLERFGGYLPETLHLLDAIMQLSSVELAQRVAWAINAEAGSQVNTAREAATQKAWQLQKQLEQVEAQHEQEIAGLREKQRTRVDKLKLKAASASDMKELEQARATLIQLYQSQAREEEEIHRLYVLAQNLQTSLGAARYRITELEEKQSHVSEQNLEDCQQKLIQAGQRITKLEGQVAIQRERLGQYYHEVAHLEQELATYRETVDLSDRARLERQLYDIGEQIGYRQFIPGEHSLAVGHGIECWRAFTENASDEEVAQAIVRVRYFAQNLIDVSAQAEVQRLKGRIRELECQLAQPT